MASASMIPHGTLDYAELRRLGLHPEELLVFSSNINPYGPPPAVAAALQAAATPEMISRYPDRLSLELRDLLAEFHALAPENILVGNGTADILWLIGLLHLQQQRVVIIGPTFGEYANVAQLMRAEIITVCHPGWMQRGDTFIPGPTTLDDTARALTTARPHVVFLCNPNNPTGQALDEAALEQLYAAAPAALWVMDEAYAEFMAAPVGTAAWSERGNWLVLRSMTKDFALGGLRLGYVVGAPPLIAALQDAQSPWNVNAFAQLAGAICLHNLAWRNETLAQLRQHSRQLRTALADVGFAPLPTTLNFFLLPVNNPPTLRQALLAQRIVVRDCTSFGLPHYIRIAVQQPPQNQQLVEVLAALAP